MDYNTGKDGRLCANDLKRTIKQEPGDEPPSKLVRNDSVTSGGYSSNISSVKECTRVIILPTSTPPKRPSKLHRCRICSKIFAGANFLSKHFAEKHSNEASNINKEIVKVRENGNNTVNHRFNLLEHQFNRSEQQVIASQQQFKESQQQFNKSQQQFNKSQQQFSIVEPQLRSDPYYNKRQVKCDRPFNVSESEDLQSSLLEQQIKADLEEHQSTGKGRKLKAWEYLVESEVEEHQLRSEGHRFKMEEHLERRDNGHRFKMEEHLERRDDLRCKGITHEEEGEEQELEDDDETEIVPIIRMVLDQRERDQVKVQNVATSNNHNRISHEPPKWGKANQRTEKTKVESTVTGKQGSGIYEEMEEIDKERRKDEYAWTEDEKTRELIKVTRLGHYGKFIEYYTTSKSSPSKDLPCRNLSRDKDYSSKYFQSKELQRNNFTSKSLPRNNVRRDKSRRNNFLGKKVAGNSFISKNAMKQLGLSFSAVKMDRKVRPVVVLQDCIRDIKDVHHQRTLKSINDQAPLVDVSKTTSNGSGSQESTCTICLESFNDPLTLKEHRYVKNHYDSFWICHFCPLKFSSREVLNRHQEKEHLTELQNYTKTINGIKNRGVESHECKLCGMRFDSDALLQAHIPLHGETARYDFVCSVCKETFDDLIDLGHHRYKNNHFSEFFSCKVCNWKYTEQGLLDNHIKKTHGITMFTSMLASLESS